MKISKIMITIFVCCFLLGIGIISMPETVKAGPNPCLSCYQISCYSHPSCDTEPWQLPQVMHQKCYGSALEQDGCLALHYTCGCHDIGCGDPCQIQ